MTGGERDAYSALSALLGEDRGSLLKTAQIEIREMSEGRFGYHSIMVDTVTLKYNQPVLFIDYRDLFYIISSNEDTFKDITDNKPLDVLKFEKVEGPGTLRGLVRSKNTKIFTNTQDINGHSSVIYLDTMLFPGKAFKTVEDLYAFYAFTKHRDEFMKHMLDRTASSRSSFLSIIETEYHYGLNNK